MPHPHNVKYAETKWELNMENTWNTYFQSYVVDQQHQDTGDMADCWQREKGDMGVEGFAKIKSDRLTKDTTMWIVTLSRRQQEWHTHSNSNETGTGSDPTLESN